MASPHLDQDEFLSRLVELLGRRKGSDHGAVHLTQKRLTHGQGSPSALADDASADQAVDQPMPVIIRASDGTSKRSKKDKVKFSVIVYPHELDGFYSRYAEVCKAGMAALKPRDRNKKRAKAKRKKATS